MLGISVDYHGPIFQGDAGQKVVKAISDSIHDLMIEGEKKIDANLYAGHGLKTGHYRRSVHGEMTSTLHGRIHDSKVVYGPWLEGVGSRNQRSRFKGYWSFRQAYQHLEKIKDDVVRKWINRLVGDLNGR